MSESKEIMTPDNPRWKEFHERLEGPEGCNFRKDRHGKTHWKCDANNRKRPLAVAILQKMGNVDIPATLEYFDNHGGYCDCEILFNVKV